MTPVNQYPDEVRIVALLASSALLLVLCAQVAVYRGAWVSFAPLAHSRYASLGQALLAVGALGLLVNIAWMDIRWSLATRSRTGAPGPGAVESDPVLVDRALDPRDDLGEDRPQRDPRLGP